MVTTELGACEWFVWDLRRSNLIDRGRLDQVISEFLQQYPRAEPAALAEYLVTKEVLTQFQADRLLAGRTDGFLLGPYVVLEQVGRGALSRVYKAKHRTMHRTVAIKVLSSELTDTPEHRGALADAVRDAGKLAHANINVNGEAAGLALINRLNPNYLLKTAVQFKDDTDPNTSGNQPGKWAERVLTSDGQAITLPPATVPWPIEKTWKPPESVMIGRSHAWKRCSPPSLRMSSWPGVRNRWNVFPSTMSNPSSPASRTSSVLTTAFVARGTNAGVRTSPCARSIRITRRCRARPSRMPLPPSPAARPSSA